MTVVNSLREFPSRRASRAFCVTYGKRYPKNLQPYRQRHFRSICAKAGIGHRTPKDLRDSFASHLLSMGGSLGFISGQLGHANAQVTADHYARWLGGADYQTPEVLAPGEVPADLLSRCAPISPQTASKLEAALAEARKT
jgi:integrase